MDLIFCLSSCLGDGGVFKYRCNQTLEWCHFQGYGSKVQSSCVLCIQDLCLFHNWDKYFWDTLLLGLRYFGERLLGQRYLGQRCFGQSNISAKDVLAKFTINVTFLGKEILAKIFFLFSFYAIQFFWEKKKKHLAKMSLAVTLIVNLTKTFLAQMSLWPKCLCLKQLWPKFLKPKFFCPKFHWPRSTSAKISLSQMWNSHLVYPPIWWKILTS